MNNVQIIKNNGIPSHVVWIMPIDEYKAIQRSLPQDYHKRHTIPHEVVAYMVENQSTLIEAWRKCLRLTQTEVAQKMGITQGSYSTIENTKNNQLKTLEQIAAAFGIPLALLSLED